MLANNSCIRSSQIQAFSLSIALVTIVSSLIGNTLILVIICRFSGRFRGGMYVLISNLAVIDLLLVGILILISLKKAFPVINTYHSCKASFSGLTVFLLASGLTLNAMSVDRFLAVFFPTKHLLLSAQRKWYVIAIVIVWIVAILVTCLPILNHYNYGNDNYGKENYDFCEYSLMVPHNQSLATALILAAEFIVNTVFYVLIFLKIKFYKVPMRTSHRARSRSTLMVIIFIVFVIFWMPFVILTILVNMSTTLEVSTLICIREYVDNLGVLHSGFNWIIYGLANQKFREALKLLLFDRKGCCGKVVPTRRSSSRAFDLQSQQMSMLKSHPADSY